MPNKKKKHSQRQGHPARLHPTSNQQSGKGSLPKGTKASGGKTSYQWSMVDLGRLGLLSMALLLAAVLVGWDGKWVMPLAGSIWCCAVLLPLMFRHAQGMGLWMLGMSILMIVLAILQTPSGPQYDYTSSSNSATTQPAVSAQPQPVVTQQSGGKIAGQAPKITIKR